MNNAQRSTSLSRVALKVSARAQIHIQVCLAANLAFSPPPHAPSLNCTAGSMEVSVISLSLLWGSFPTPAASQKANYARQWPASSNRIFNGCGAISVSAWSAALYPVQSSQGALAAWQQVISAACFCCLSVQTAYFKSSCDISLTCPEFPFHLPFCLSQRPVKSQSWQLSKQCQGRVENLLSDLLIGMWRTFHWDSSNEDYFWTTYEEIVSWALRKSMVGICVWRESKKETLN